MSRFYLCYCVIFWLPFNIVAKEKPNKIKVLAAQSEADVSHAYVVGLLDLSLKNGGAKYGETKVELVRHDNINHESVVRLIKDKYIDVMWSGFSPDREKEMKAIPVPLVRGLLGYRVSIIHKDNLSDFKARGRLAFNNKLACQGKYWPDIKVLSDNGHNVRKIHSYEQIFQLVSRKKCDYFPRAIFEAYGEIKAAQDKHPELVVFDDVILNYLLPYLFFVNKDNHELFEKITYGLKESISNGSYDEFMKRHMLTKELYPLSQWKNKQFIFLENSDLPNGYKPIEGMLLKLH
jgi:hypothetical protein